MGKSVSDKTTGKQNLRGTKKGLNKTKIPNSDDVDSLSCFKQKKNENIDDKFKLLKSELNSLFLNSKADASESLSSFQTQLNQTEDCNKFKQHQNSNTSLTPNSSKFSEWLSDTIEKMEAESAYTSVNKKFKINESMISNAKVELKPKYNMTLLPKYKVEQLLYKSFQLQNLGIFLLSSSDESEPEQNKSRRSRVQKKTKSKMQGKAKAKASSRSYSSSFPRKRRKASLNNDMEIMHSKAGLNKNRSKKIECVDLDVDSFDWNEPFHAKNSTDFSDLEIIEDGQIDISVQKKKQHDSGELNPEESDFSTNAQKQNSNKSFLSDDTKRTWECPICFEPSHGQSIVATQCGHIFCKACLEKHNSVHGIYCPTCRLDISDKPPITLFNL